jgi:hypothetical protein
LITQLIAIAAWFILIDFPDTAHKKGFLTKIDADFMEKRIEDDRGDAVPDTLTWVLFMKHLCDLKLWALYVHRIWARTLDCQSLLTISSALMFMAAMMPAYVFDLDLVA